ncbi:S1/P1 nuclease [Azohydromonas aeria]|uniref:S1/P1 nuclease n=1 Tax=Azohydromonas aeria TaxID=2590212 RepID=UPI0012FA57DB|nr:S1/P1 nuclease [Azohydromonas aeria]
MSRLPALRLSQVLPLPLLAAAGAAFAWGDDGHSAVAEIAQHRLSRAAAARVAEVLGPGRSLASVASWPDDHRARLPGTGPWHYVNIPSQAGSYEPARDCGKPEAPDACAVAQLQRLRRDLRCAPTPQARREALIWTVHLVGDLHQPLHAYGDARGGNDIPVTLQARGPLCGDRCKPQPQPQPMSLHAAWDFGLLGKLAPSWGALVAQVEEGFLSSPEGRAAQAGMGAGAVLDPVAWANASHALGGRFWRPADAVLDDAYLEGAAPVLMQQLGLAGVRLAGMLNQAYASRACPRR